LWLNEGFATAFETKGVNAVHPEWEMAAQFSVTSREEALELDGMKSTHPISQTVTRPEEIGQLFDAISYEKGGSILRMLEAFVDNTGVCTKDTGSVGAFQAGLRLYLQRHMYGNAATKDLWQAIEDVCGFPIIQMMTTWTGQKGFPLLDANVSPTPLQSSGAKLQLTQSAFFARAAGIPSEQQWEIPLVSVSSQSGIVYHSFPSTSASFSLPAPFILNPNASGFFRIRYPVQYVDNFLAPRTTTENQLATRADFAAMVSDLFAEAELDTSEKRPEHVLDLLRAWLPTQRDYVVWTAALDGLTGYLSRLEDTSVFPLLQRAVLAMIRPTLVATQGSKTHLDILLRARLLSLAVWLNDRDTVSALDGRFQNTSLTILPDDRAAVYAAGVKRGGAEAWNVMFSRYQSATSPSEQTRCLYALCRTPEHSLLRTMLDVSLDPAIVKAQDVLSVITLVGRNIHGRGLAWSWFREHFDQLVGTFASGNAYLTGRLIKSVTAHFATVAERRDVTDFFARNPVAAGSRGLEQALEQIDGNIEWLARHKENVRKVLAKTHSQMA
jgi:aminopeptidase N